MKIAIDGKQQPLMGNLDGQFRIPKFQGRKGSGKTIEGKTNL
jgi:hypothetical protein